MVLKQCMQVKNACYVTNRKMAGNKPTGIVVHSTGANNPMLKRYVQPLKTDGNYAAIIADIGVNQYGNHWNVFHPGGKDLDVHQYVDANGNGACDVCGGRQVCVHAFIGKNAAGRIETYQILPFDVCCWGSGGGSKGSYNFGPARVQFEICEDGLTDKAYFLAAFQEAAEFCAYLCKLYNLPVEQICSHAEAYKAGCGTNHGDPDHWLKRFGENMDGFREKVAALLGGEKTTAESSTYEVGTSNEQTVYNFMTSVLGLNKAGACGVLANIQCESAFKPDALGDSGTSYGICQWHAGRYAALKTWCASNGKNYQTLDGQLWYLKYELERSYTSVLAYIRAVEDTAEGAYNAGHRWCAKFEIPANTEVNAQKRGELAKGTYWTKYNRTSGSSSVTLGAPGNVSKNDLVSLSADAKYYSGATMPDWVKNQNWYVTSVVGDRAVLGQNESGKNNICSPVNTKYLTALKPTGSTQSAYVPAVGDLVYYNGNVHYTAADATTAKPCVGGQARITRIYKLGKSKHPYSLVRVAGKGATVWGWVDEGTFTKV